MKNFLRTNIKIIVSFVAGIALTIVCINANNVTRSANAEMYQLISHKDDLLKLNTASGDVFILIPTEKIWVKLPNRVRNWDKSANDLPSP